MGNNKINGVSAGTGLGQALAFEQLFSQGGMADIASAATTDIGAQNTNFLRVTGNTTITSFGSNFKGPRFLVFEGAVTLTNSSTLVLPGGANITTAAGDVLIAIPGATLGTADKWIVTAYQKNKTPSESFFLGTRGITGLAGLSTAENTTGGGVVVVRDSASTFNPNGVEFYTNGAERGRFDINGNYMVGTTIVQSGNSSDPVGISLYGASSRGVGVFVRESPNSVLYVNNKTSGGGLIQFFNGGASVGQITSNGSTTTYGTSSDYRLKENIKPMTGALARVAALRPVTYKWKSSGQEDEGFIAHELQDVCPSAVFGKKDEVSEDGSIKPQSIDTSFLVATLTAAIQEQQSIINALAARVEKLEIA
jgi:hypothetical protein